MKKSDYHTNRYMTGVRLTPRDHEHLRHLRRNWGDGDGLATITSTIGRALELAAKVQQPADSPQPHLTAS